MTQPQDPGALLQGVVEARAAGNIEISGYQDALKVLEKHFWVYEQRLRVISAPASFPEGEVLLQAGFEGLEKFQNALGTLKNLDPKGDSESAEDALSKAQEGIELLMQVQSVTSQKEQEFAEALDELESEDEE